MCDHDERLAELIGGSTQEREYLGARPGVEVACRLVSEDHLWAAHEGSGYGNSLLLSTG